jgi:MarR family transcriptional regulator, organic hydroperoxide resistance regulator
MMTSNEPRGGRARAAAVDPVGIALVAAARSHRAVLQRELAAIGLHLGQELVIVDRLCVEQPTVAKTIARLARVGLVTRAPDADDRRHVRIQLTDHGAALAPRVLGACAAADRAASDALTAAERKTLIRLLHKVADRSERDSTE